MPKEEPKTLPKEEPKPMPKEEPKTIKEYTYRQWIIVKFHY
jgi:hypothetical protein